MGQALGNNFREAVILFAKSPKAKGWGNFNEDNLSFWGCKVFDNLTDAQKNFG